MLKDKLYTTFPIAGIEVKIRRITGFVVDEFGAALVAALTETPEDIARAESWASMDEAERARSQARYQAERAAAAMDPDARARARARTVALLTESVCAAREPEGEWEPVTLTDDATAEGKDGRWWVGLFSEQEQAQLAGAVWAFATGGREKLEKLNRFPSVRPAVVSRPDGEAV